MITNGFKGIIITNITTNSKENLELVKGIKYEFRGLVFK